jgi:hypothetical protein
VLGLGLTLTQVAVRGGAGHVVGPQILISGRAQDENTAIGTAIGTLSVVGGTGTYTFTKTADPDSAFTLTAGVLKNAIVFDYETAIAHNVTIHADNGAGSTVDRVLVIFVNDIDEVPAVITSSPTQTIPENSAFSLTLTADKAVTWSKTGGADTALFTLTGAVLTMAAKDFEIPTDANTDNVYVVQVTATSTAYAPATTNQTINVTVTGVAPGTPTIVWTSATTVTPPVFSFTAPSDPDLVVGDNVHFQRATDSGFTTSVTDYNNTVDSTEDAANALTFTSGTWANGTWYVRARTERGEGISAWSNTETKTLAAGSGLLTNLISYWEFESTSWLDSHTTANTLTPHNSPSLGTGVVGNSAQLGAASSKYFSHVNNTSLNVAGTDFSIAVWVYYDAGTSGTAIVSKSGGGFAFDFRVGAGYVTANLPDFSIANVSNVSNTVGFTGSLPSDPRFIVAVADFTNSLIKISVGGSTFETAAITIGSITGSTADFQIGAANSTDFWDGRVDQIGFWKRALTQAEVTFLYNSGAGRAYSAL